MVTDKNDKKSNTGNIIIYSFLFIGATYVIFTILYHLTTFAPTFNTYEKQYEYTKREYTDAMTIVYIFPGSAQWKWLKTWRAVRKLEKLYPNKAHQDPAVLGALERSSYMLGRYKESLKYLDEGSKLFMEKYFIKDGKKDYGGAIFFYNSKARCYLGLYEYGKAMGEYQKIIDNYSNIQDKTVDISQLLGDAYMNIVKIYVKLKQYDKAIEWCEKWGKNLKDSLQIAFAREYCARVYLELDQIDKAKDMYKSIINLYKGTKDDWVTGAAKMELERLNKNRIVTPYQKVPRIY